MNKANVADRIRQSAGVGEVQEIQYKPEFLVLRLFYNYDEDELEAARDYADSESNESDSEDIWYDEYYLPYLTDLAVDEVSDTIEELVEDEDINAEYISYELDRDDEDLEFIVVFSDEGTDVDIDSILDSLGL